MTLSHVDIEAMRSSFKILIAARLKETESELQLCLDTLDKAAELDDMEMALKAWNAGAAIAKVRDAMIIYLEG